MAFLGGITYIYLKQLIKKKELLFFVISSD